MADDHQTSAEPNSSTDGNCAEDSHLEKTQEIVKDVMHKAALLVRAATDLPRRGDEFELCNSFSAFTAFMEQQETRIRLMLTSLMRNTGCPTRMPKLNCEVEEYLERIVMVDDHVVERAGIVMDELDRGGRDDVEVPKTIIGAESTKRKKAEAEARFQERIHASDPGSVLAEQLRLAYEELKAAKVANVKVKPQKEYGFESSIDNSTNPFVPKLKIKHNALPRKETSGMVIIDEHSANIENQSDPSLNYEADVPHPYQLEIQNFVVPSSQMESKEPIASSDIDGTSLTMIKTKEDLERLRDVLNSCREFAVDLEHHDFRSYLGITCLIQISTRSEDYIIDPFPLWNELHILNDPFTNPEILKVFHGGEHDIEWLQRDFGIYVVNMFDTGRAMRRLEMQKFNLRYLVQHYCDVTLNKKYQLADWRERPLDSDMIHYARSDTHYLLYCYDRLREELLEKGDAMQNLLRVVYSESAFICSRVYQKPSFDRDGFRGLERRLLNNRQEAAMRVLWHWRDRVAREEDESVQYVLPNHMLLTIAESLPRELQGILLCCNPVPPLVRECVHELHKMIFKCRDIPLIEYKNEMTIDSYEQMLRQRNMSGQFTKENVFIICPLDFSQTEFDEESGSLVPSSKVEESCPVIERSATHTLLSVLDSATVLGKETDEDCKTFSVVDERPAANVDKVKQIMERLQATPTPYECYTIAVNQARKKENEEKSKKNGETTPLPTAQKMYTHHDPATERPAVSSVSGINEDVIDLSDEAFAARAESSFADSEILTKKELKRKRKIARKIADISTELPKEGNLAPEKKRTKKGKKKGNLSAKKRAVGENKTSEVPSSTANRMKMDNKDISTELPGEEGPSYTVKRVKRDDEEEEVKSFDYSQFDKTVFNEKPSGLDNSFDPFNQKHRVENKKNFRRRGRGGLHRMGTMSIGYTPSSKK
uniref:Exosome complex component 10 homolog n=1 Tax=Haemonchus contortus TaxID=6289 RepID=A0A7I4Y6P7_HAECO|nr:3'-5' exonuclease and Helicase RNase D C-terminal domain containing protein [Haemonchus contortus]